MRQYLGEHAALTGCLNLVVVRPFTIRRAGSVIGLDVIHGQLQDFVPSILPRFLLQHFGQER